MSREQYVELLRDLLSGDPVRIRRANLALYRVAVIESSAGVSIPDNGHKREADLVLAEIAG